MSKQINLLAQVRDKPELSALRALLGFGAMLAAFLIYAVFGWFGASRLENTVTQKNLELVAQSATLKSLEQKLSERPTLASLVAATDALKAQLDESQAIVNLLRAGGDAAAGYSGQLKALARVSEDGVWLTEVTIDSAGKTISLTGRSLNNESVLRYAQHLNEQFSAYGVQFNQVALTPAVSMGGGGAAAGPGLSSIAFTLF